MKIVTWNCKGAYRKKHSRLIESFDPDIWIIQECEHPDKFNQQKGFIRPDNVLWYGDNLNRGVGVFSKHGIGLNIEEMHNSNFRYIIPVKVSGLYELNLFAVWAMNDTVNKQQRYIGQVFSSLEYYRHLFANRTVFAGDFNWNTSFKATGRLTGDLDDVIKYFGEINIISAYHKIHKEKFGEESKATLHFHGKNQSPFHIDYIFLNRSLCSNEKMTIGKWAEWHMLSDHMPICLDICK
ncbi:MAG: endonuclease/exonuclease/phosphatase family protein [Chloroflexi bacterium]|nr:endonuclease/exonuclease/phosphatase family protein [Chloroflexota bacterium]